MQAALIIAYPLLAHFAVITQAPGLQALAIFLLASGLLFTPLKKGEKSAWSILVLMGLTLLVIVSSWANATIFALYMPPILLPLLLFGVFGRTLMPGQTPIITAIGEEARGPLSTELRSYTRRVTLLWTTIFFAMVSASLLLPFLASKELWSLFTNLINYLVVAALFVGEYIYRRLRFRDHDHPSFPDYLRIVFRSEIRNISHVTTD